MTRREILYLGPGYCLLPRMSAAQSIDAPEPIPDPHFPSRLYAFIWRNWELANADHIAKVLRTTPAAVLEIGASMGLPKKPLLSGDQLARLYITVIRQNWHILPDEQIVEAARMDTSPLSIHPEGRRFPRHQAGPQTTLQRTSVPCALRGGHGAGPRDPRHGAGAVWRFHQPAGRRPLPFREAPEQWLRRSCCATMRPKPTSR